METQVAPPSVVRQNDASLGCDRVVKRAAPTRLVAKLSQ
jgi:hypothetical protein